jgi:hypothetical protein
VRLSCKIDLAQLARLFTKDKKSRKDGKQVSGLLEITPNAPTSAATD